MRQGVQRIPCPHVHPQESQQYIQSDHSVGWQTCCKTTNLAGLASHPSSPETPPCQALSGAKASQCKGRQVGRCRWGVRRECAKEMGGYLKGWVGGGCGGGGGQCGGCVGMAGHGTLLCCRLATSQPVLAVRSHRGGGPREVLTTCWDELPGRSKYRYLYLVGRTSHNSALSMTITQYNI